ncbi:MAG TPA: hypothetical protein VMU54_00495 [Planctomycetota bacterium]|nr:hypothetical protein [Planctomycetota bacterium]
MTLSPIHRVLSTFRRRKVRALLMGGQACILYGAAEFTRDVDLAVAVDPPNLKRLQAALRDLQAETIYFPGLSKSVLRRGHACHFRTQSPGLHRLRIDIMSRMRGVDPFSRLWKRREEFRLPGVGIVALLALPDLVKAKKTQRDKDWPMIRRLIEADVARHSGDADALRVDFWMRECRTVNVLRELARRYPEAARRAATGRPALREILRGGNSKAADLLRKEEDVERARDRRYWAPLRRELEKWRLGR